AIGLVAVAQDSAPAESRPAESRRATPPAVLRESTWTTWTIDGAKREALIHLPWKKKGRPAPVVFAFHGHGGNARNAAEMFQFHNQWPEALVVYMEGLATPGR